MKSILLPIDGSTESLYAVEVALRCAANTGARIVAESVVDSETLWSVLGSDSPGLIGSGPYMAAREVLSAAMHATSEALLLSFEARADAYNVNSEAVIDEGNLLREILRRSQEHDLVIVGHHKSSMGCAEDRYIVRHSVCERLSTVCPSPLLIVQHPVAWENARLVVNKQTAVKPVIEQFCDIAAALELLPEIYLVCNEDEQDQLAPRIAKMITPSKRARLITRDWQECDDAWDCAQDVHENTMLAITTADEPRSTCGGTSPASLVHDLRLPAVLIMPPSRVPATRS